MIFAPFPSPNTFQIKVENSKSKKKHAYKITLLRHMRHAKVNSTKNVKTSFFAIQDFSPQNFSTMQHLTLKL